jgi:hypothetical protein
MPLYMHTNCLLFASYNKLLNNSTFYHLKSLIALPIEIIRGFLGVFFWGGGWVPLQVSPLNYCMLACKINTLDLSLSTLLLF